MTRRKNPTELTEQLTETPTTVQLLRINGTLRIFLRPAEVAALCDVDIDRVYEWIHSGVIAHCRDALGTAHYPIPVSELARLQAMAHPA